jgi:ribosomal protein S3
MEWYREGRVPLRRAPCHYGTAEAQAAYGTCGVGWVFKGEILSTTR